MGRALAAEGRWPSRKLGPGRRVRLPNARPIALLPPLALQLIPCCCGDSGWGPMALKRHRTPPTIPAATRDELQGERGEQGNGASVGGRRPLAELPARPRQAYPHAQRPPHCPAPPSRLA